MAYKNIDALKNIAGKRVLVRLDLNVPLEKDDQGGVSDDTRIRSSLETLKELSGLGAKIIILAHLGRPKEITPALSNRRLLQALQTYWKESPVLFIEDLLDAAAVTIIDQAPSGSLILGENIRFYKGEEQNDEEFSKQLARLGDIYINDGFSVSHRAHSSTVGITRYLPTFAGRLLEKELNALHQCLENPQSPVMAIVGGAKVSTKLKMLHYLIEKMDYLVVGGGMANTFLMAQGLNIGKSLCEGEKVTEAQQILQRAQQLGKHILLPIDVVVKDLVENIRTIKVQQVGENDCILDSGPASTAQLKQTLQECKTVLWNGPIGLFEVPPFDQATLAIADMIADQTLKGRLISVAGGGDTIAALNKAKRGQDFTFVSTAGGAFLEWLEGLPLPGIQALNDQQ